MQTRLDVLRIAGGIFAILSLIFLLWSIFRGTRSETFGHQAVDERMHRPRVAKMTFH